LFNEEDFADFETVFVNFESRTADLILPSFFSIKMNNVRFKKNRVQHDSFSEIFRFFSQ